MTVRDAMERILTLEENMALIDKARRAGFDLDVSAEEIEAARSEIEWLCGLEVNDDMEVEG